VTAQELRVSLLQIGEGTPRDVEIPVGEDHRHKMTTTRDGRRCGGVVAFRGSGDLQLSRRALTRSTLYRQRLSWRWLHGDHHPRYRPTNPPSLPLAPPFWTRPASPYLASSAPPLPLAP